MSVSVVCANCGYENSSNRSTCKNCRQPLIVSTPPERILEEDRSSAEYRYLVVPFVGKLRAGVFDLENANKVTEQLQNLINSYTVYGWDFYRIEKVNILVQPGCLASLFGVQASFLTFDQVIFRIRR